MTDSIGSTDTNTGNMIQRSHESSQFGARSPMPPLDLEGGGLSALLEPGPEGAAGTAGAAAVWALLLSPTPVPTRNFEVTPMPTRDLSSEEDMNPGDADAVLRSAEALPSSAASHARIQHGSSALRASTSSRGSKQGSLKGSFKGSFKRFWRTPSQQGGWYSVDGGDHRSAAASGYSGQSINLSGHSAPSAGLSGHSGLSTSNAGRVIVNLDAARARAQVEREGSARIATERWDGIDKLERARSGAERHAPAARRVPLSKSLSLEQHQPRPAKLLLKTRSLENHLREGGGMDAVPSAVSDEWLEQSVMSSVGGRAKSRHATKTSRSIEGEEWSLSRGNSKIKGLLDRSVSLKEIQQSLKGLVSPDKRTIKVMKERHWKREASPGGTQVADCSPKHSGHGVSSWPKDKDNAGHGLSSWPKEKEREQGREEERARGRRRSESPAGSSRDRFRGIHSLPLPPAPAYLAQAPVEVEGVEEDHEGEGEALARRTTRTVRSKLNRDGTRKSTISFEFDATASVAQTAATEDGRSSGDVTRTASDGHASTGNPKATRFPLLPRRVSEVFSASESVEGGVSAASGRRSSIATSMKTVRQFAKTKFSIGRRASVVGDNTYVFMNQDSDEELEEEHLPRPLLSMMMRWLGLRCSITLAALFLLISTIQILTILAATASFGILAIKADTDFVHSRSGDAIVYVKNLLHREVMQASVSQIRTAIDRLPKCAEETVEGFRVGKVDMDNDTEVERHLYSQVLHWDVVYAFIGKRSGEAIMAYRGNNAADPSKRPFLALYTNSYNEAPNNVDPGITDGSLLEFMVDEEGIPRNLSEFSNSVPGYRGRLRPWYNVTRHRQTATWIGPYLWIPDLLLGIDICIPIYDEASTLPKVDRAFDADPPSMWEPAQESLLAVGCCDTTLDELSRLLAGQNLGGSGRAFVVEVGGEGDGKLIAAAKRGAILPISTTLKGNVDDVRDGSDTSELRYERVSAVDSEDPVIAGVSKYLLGDSHHPNWVHVGRMSMAIGSADWKRLGMEEAVQSEIVVSSDTLLGQVANFKVSENGTWAPENYQTEGLHWLLVIAIQSDDFTQEIDQSRKDAEEATAQHVRDEGLLTIVIFLSAALTAVAASSSISKPLNMLSHKMRLLRNLQYSESYESQAWIREIGALQSYMLRLRENVRVFDKFVPQTIVERMKMERTAETQTAGKLWSEQRMCTVMQSTVKGLSALSEVVPLETMLELLEDYMTTCTRIIEASGGVLVDNQGDEVLAFWTDRIPDHAAAACEAVLEQISQLETLFSNWSQQYSSHVRLVPMFGLHSAVGFVGNFGTAKRLKYGVVGEVVDVASRVNAMNRINHTTFLISESTWEAVHGRYLRKYVGTVPVKSGTQSDNVYVVTGRTSWNPKLNLVEIRAPSDFVEVVEQRTRKLGTSDGVRYLLAFLSLAGVTAWGVGLVVRGDGAMKVVAIILLVLVAIFGIWAVILGGASRLFKSVPKRPAAVWRARHTNSVSSMSEAGLDAESALSFNQAPTNPAPATPRGNTNNNASTLQRPYSEGERGVPIHTDALMLQMQRDIEHRTSTADQQADPPLPPLPPHHATKVRRAVTVPDDWFGSRTRTRSAETMRGSIPERRGSETTDQRPSVNGGVERGRRRSSGLGGSSFVLGLEGHSFMARLGSTWSKDWVGGNKAVRQLSGWGRRLRKKSNIRTRSAAQSGATRPRLPSFSSRAGSAETDFTDDDVDEEGGCSFSPSVWWVVMAVGLVVIVVAMGLGTLVHIPRYSTTLDLVRTVSEDATRSMSAKFIQELHSKVFWELVRSLNELNTCAHETRVQFIDHQLSLDRDQLPRLERHFFGQVLRRGFTWAYMGVKSATGRDRFIGASRIDYLDASVRPDIDLTTNFYNTPPDNISEYHDTTTLILDFGYDGYPRKGSQRVAVEGYNVRMRPWFVQTERAGTAIMVEPYLWVGEPYHLQLGVDACAPFDQNNDTLVSCCAMSFFDVSHMLSVQSLGATGVAFVVESKGALQGTLLAAALAGETIAVTQGSKRILASDSSDALISAVSRYLLGLHGTWDAVPDGYSFATDIPLRADEPLRRKRAKMARGQKAPRPSNRRMDGMDEAEMDHAKEDDGRHNVLADLEDMFEEHGSWEGEPLQLVVQEYDGSLPMHVDQLGRWQSQPYRAGGIQLKLVIALADVDAHRLSEVYAESRSQEAKHVSSYALICAAVSLFCVFLSHAAATEVSLPMQQLERALAKVTELDFDRTPEIETFVKDVKRIQEGFRIMHGCLCTFDKFVPSAVIARVMSKHAAERAMAGCPWMRVTQCTVVHCRIWGFSKVAENVSLEQALEMMERYMRVCSDIIKNYRGTVSDFMGVQIVSFWQEEDGYAGPSFKELACQAVLRQAEEVQQLFSMWRRMGVRGSQELHFAAGMYSGKTYVGNFGTPSRLKYGVASETAAIAARLCNLTEIYSDSARRAGILASGGTLCEDAVVETGRADEGESVPLSRPGQPTRGSVPAMDAMDRARRFKEGGGWFGASTKLFRGSQVMMPAVKSALVHLNKQFRWRKVDVIHHFNHEMGKDVTEDNLKMEIYELLGSLNRGATSVSPTLDSNAGADLAHRSPAPTSIARRQFSDGERDTLSGVRTTSVESQPGLPRINADLGTLSDGKWHGAGPPPTTIHLPIHLPGMVSPLIKPAKTRRVSLFGLSARGPSSGSEPSVQAPESGVKDVSIGLGRIDWGRS